MWLWGLDFKSLGGTLLFRGLNSRRGKGELNSQRGLDSGYYIFLQTCYFYGGIIINYSYSNIFDILELLTQNDYGPT